METEICVQYKYQVIVQMINIGLWKSKFQENWNLLQFWDPDTSEICHPGSF